MSELNPVTQIITLMLDELKRAEHLWLGWPDSLAEQALILLEESGEVAKAVNDHIHSGKSIEAVEEEAIQTGAMAIRFLLHLKMKVMK